MPKLTLRSPAKLNLMLQITGRRKDSYHYLQTVFQFIDLVDHIHFETIHTPDILRTASQTPIEESDDIIIRAAQQLKHQCDIHSGVRISIRKRIPIGGGLGGGSSNAATCLLALNKLWELDLSIKQLAEIGLKLGADVPVFIHGLSAWAEGIGEQIKPIHLPEPWYLIIYPNIHVSTTEIFNARELTRNCQAITIRDFENGARTNVCEPIVRQRYPVIGEALDWLGRYAEARMSGTGACVYAAFNNRKAAESVKWQVPAYWQVFIAKGMNQNPVHRQCGITT